MDKDRRMSFKPTKKRKRNRADFQNIPTDHHNMSRVHGNPFSKRSSRAEEQNPGLVLRNVLHNGLRVVAGTGCGSGVWEHTALTADTGTFKGGVGPSLLPLAKAGQKEATARGSS